MKFGQQLKSYYELYSSLYDEESKVILEARFKYNLGGISWKEMCDAFFPYIKNRKWKYISLFDYFENREDVKNKRYIIFGVGDRGHNMYQFLISIGIEVVAFSDNSTNKHGKTLDGIPIISPKEIKKRYKDCYILIAIFQQEIQATVYRQLLLYGIKPTNILLLRSGSILSMGEDTYFDFPTFKSQKDEIFIDAGCYDGDTAFDFIRWCNGNYKKIYAFEPDNDNYEVCVKNLKQTQNVEIIKKGLWDIQTELRFSEDFSDASRISDNGSCTIPVTTIDEVLNGRKATFIKMDIEGSELEALRGAANTIRKYRPKLAICIYHKRTDIFDIPLYIKELIPDYNMGLRVYTNIGSDIVLYAW